MVNQFIGISYFVYKNKSKNIGVCVEFSNQLNSIWITVHKMTDGNLKSLVTIARSASYT